MKLNLKTCYSAVLFAVLCFWANATFAQKHDYVWLSGYDFGYGSGCSCYFGTTVLDFNYTPLKNFYDTTKPMYLDKTNTSFSDSTGNLMFYSNGIYIADSAGQKIENSDSLNAGYMQYVWDPSIQIYGYRNTQGILAIPSPSNKNQYYLVHSYSDLLPDGILIRPIKIQVTLLDMSLNNGHGKVLYKNQPLVTDTFCESLTATRHGNGRDWWILAQKVNTNCYYRILVDSTGPHVVPGLTCGGDTVLITAGYRAVIFSPYGDKFVLAGTYEGINIFDFDRCSGELSNAIHLPLNLSNGGGGISISPNNRFLYFSELHHLYQFDLWASDIWASKLLIGTYDGAIIGSATLFDRHQSGPDGKIYIGCSSGTAMLHVIHQPNLLGTACDFRQHEIIITPSIGVPHFPNYRLGYLNGSACDTLTHVPDAVRELKEKIISAYPNPTTDIVVIDYGYTDWNKKGGVSLEITNAFGQIVYTQTLPAYSALQKIDVSNFTNGFYNVSIKRNSQIIAVAKLVKQ